MHLLERCHFVEQFQNGFQEVEDERDRNLPTVLFDEIAEILPIDVFRNEGNAVDVVSWINPFLQIYETHHSSISQSIRLLNFGAPSRRRLIDADQVATWDDFA